MGGGPEEAYRNYERDRQGLGLRILEIGAISEEVIAFSNAQKWPWPKGPKGFLGSPTRVAQCFAYHLHGEGTIDFMSSIWIREACGRS